MRAIGLTLMVMGAICGIATLRYCWVRDGIDFGDVVGMGLCIGLLVGGRTALNRAGSGRFFELPRRR